MGRARWMRGRRWRGWGCEVGRDRGPGVLSVPVRLPVVVLAEWVGSAGSASVGGDVLAVEGEGEPLDGLRALCAAAWLVAGEGAWGLVC
ncbi:hypothetical protein [Streptomyces sp. NPDC003077]|uniref:hypothetical protein n=1 Tax=Streptomyces sp. NPDC003077 TaxID=3154443 RepID=UPI0033BE9E6B